MATPTIDETKFSVDPVTNTDLDTTGWAQIIATELLDILGQAGELYTLDEITTSFLADDAVTLAKMADGSVGQAQIINGAVINAKLGDSSVNAAKIASNAVTTDKINASAVTSAKIGNSQVTNAKINNGAVTADKVQDDQITVAKMSGSAPNIVFGTDGAGQEAEINRDELGGFSLQSVTDLPLNSDPDTTFDVPLDFSSNDVLWVLGRNFDIQNTRHISIGFSDDGGTTIAQPGQVQFTASLLGPSNVHNILVKLFRVFDAIMWDGILSANASGGNGGTTLQRFGGVAALSDADVLRFGLVSATTHRWAGNNVNTRVYVYGVGALALS